jgi:glutathione S-transferase
MPRRFQSTSHSSLPSFPSHKGSLTLGSRGTEADRTDVQSIKQLKTTHPKMTDKATTDTVTDEEVKTSNTSESGDVAVEGKHAGSSSVKATTPSSSTNTNSNGNSALAGMSKLNIASLGRETEGLVLFDLTTKEGARAAFSPHCMKTILDLKLLGIGYDRQRVTFTEVRNSLEKRVGENVTVPTLELANGSHLTDSWIISQYLYKKHPKGQQLFPHGASSQSFARMVEGFGKTSLAPNLAPLTRVELYNRLDTESQAYFENVKIGKAKMDKFRSMSSQEKEVYIDLCCTALEPIQAALVVARENSTNRQTWLEAGSLPTHADFVLYGWYGEWHGDPALPLFLY